MGAGATAGIAPSRLLFSARLSEFKIIVLHMGHSPATLASAHCAAASSYPCVFIGVSPLMTCAFLCSIAESCASCSSRARSEGCDEAPVVSVFSSSSSFASVLCAVPIPRSSMRLRRASIPEAPVTSWWMPMLEAGKSTQERL